jgi:putative ABC transport system permease protein
VNFKDVLNIAGRGVRERKFRFALNIIGIFIGCMAVTGLVSITQGLDEEVSGMLERFGPNNLMIMPGQLNMGAGLIASSAFNWRDIEQIERVPGIDTITPIIGNKMAKFSKQGETKYAFVYGIESLYFEINSGWDVVQGRNLNRGDSAVIVLGYEIANPKDQDEPLFEIGDRITLKVMVEGEEKEMTFRVIGVMEKMGGLAGMSSDEDNSLFMPIRTCQQLYDTKGEFQFLAAQVKDSEKLLETVAKIEEMYDNDITVMSSESMQEMIGDILGLIEAVLGGVAAISLVVAGVGIINTMTISVMERTKEIGILKAIGAKSIDVLILFITEAIITGLIGGILGVGFGFTLGKIIGRLIDMPVSTSLYLGLGVVIFAIFTTVISGLYPAFRASNLHPVEALRSE